MEKSNRRSFLKLAGVAAAGLGAAGLSKVSVAKAGPENPLEKYKTIAIHARQDAAVALVDQVVENGVLRAGVDLTFPPLQFRDPDTNEPMGYCVDLTNAIAEDLGVTVEWVEMPFAELIPGLQAGQFDWSGIALTIRPQRAQAVRFISEPWFMEDSILLVNNDFQFSDLGELDDPGVTFSNLTGSAQDASAKLQFPNATYTTFEAMQDSLLEVATGRAQASLVALWNAIPFIDENPDAPVYIWEGGSLFADMNTLMLPHGDEKTAFWLDNWMRYHGAHKLQEGLWNKWQGENLQKLEEYSKPR
ncbi:MAG: transporter substrate-binding domain-containing protein [Anaerolineales bacterium]|nr:transporter substrate-binding domain-containing protein [Anaerolineales bacterium]